MGRTRRERRHAARAYEYRLGRPARLHAALGLVWRPSPPTPTAGSPPAPGRTPAPAATADASPTAAGARPTGPWATGRCRRATRSLGPR